MRFGKYLSIVWEPLETLKFVELSFIFLDTVFFIFHRIHLFPFLRRSMMVKILLCCRRWGKDIISSITLRIVFHFFKIRISCLVSKMTHGRQKYYELFSIWRLIFFQFYFEMLGPLKCVFAHGGKHANPKPIGLLRHVTCLLYLPPLGGDTCGTEC